MVSSRSSSRTSTCSAPARTVPPQFDSKIVILEYDDNEDFEIYPTEPNSDYIRFKKTIVKATNNNQAVWKKNKQLREALYHLKRSSREKFLETKIEGSAFIAKDQMGNQYPISTVVLLPSGDIEITWPLEKRGNRKITTTSV